MRNHLLAFSQGWTLYEILRYAPQHNWSAYEEVLKTNPVLAKMVISGVVYSLGDWIAQVSLCCERNTINLFFFLVINCILNSILHVSCNFQCFEGKPLFEFDRTRMFRSGLVGFTLHGSLSHYYYQFCEVIILHYVSSKSGSDQRFLCDLLNQHTLFSQELFPSQDWWVVPAKVVFDQTAWAAVWNSIYFTVLGFLRLESPISIFNELKATFWPMLTVRESPLLAIYSLCF